MRDLTQSNLFAIISDVLGCDQTQISLDDSALTLPGWDSVNHMQLLLAVEDEFGVQFNPEEFAKLTTVQAIWERLNLDRK